METRIDVLNHLIKENSYTSYLEIGWGPSFEGVECKKKTSVDPNHSGQGIITMKSDEFFSEYNDHVDIIFVDGDHSYQQVKKDVTAALKHLKKGGCVVMHDTCPQDEKYAGIEWCGDPWKVVTELRNSRKHLTFETYPFDHGITVIRKTSKANQPTGLTPSTWAEWNQVKEQIMNFI